MPSILRILFYQLIIALLCGVPTFAQRGCVLQVINIRRETFQPVPINIKLMEIEVPRMRNITLMEGEAMGISCSGNNSNRNFIQQSRGRSRFGIISCSGGNQVFLDGELHNYNELQCRFPERGTVRTTNRRCTLNGENGVLFELGFSFYTQNITVIYVCYNSATDMTLFTTNIIRGREIKNASNATGPLSFSSLGLPQNMDALYDPSQQRSFSNIQSLSIDVDEDSYFVPGQLASQRHLMLAPEQAATFFYLNTAFMWKDVRKNWVLVEQTVRRLAEDFDIDVLIFSGTFGRLVYPDRFGILRTVQIGGIGVPQWFYKVIKNPENDITYVYLLLNDPFTTLDEARALADNLFDVTTCPRSDRNFNNVNNGYVTCLSATAAQDEVDILQNLYEQYFDDNDNEEEEN